MTFKLRILRAARPSLAACLLAMASADPAGSGHAQAIGLAPRHTGRHDYGAPIKPPILHKHKRAHPATHRGDGQTGAHAK